MFCKVKDFCEHSQAVNCSLVHTKLHNMLHNRIATDSVFATQHNLHLELAITVIPE